jgi:transposase InsO family protein
MATRRRRPQPGLIHHSDRGSQYTSSGYQDALADLKILPSMSGAGNCYDNASAESWFATLKVECVDVVYTGSNLRLSPTFTLEHLRP